MPTLHPMRRTRRPAVTLAAMLSLACCRMALAQAPAAPPPAAPPPAAPAPAEPEREPNPPGTGTPATGQPGTGTTEPIEDTTPLITSNEWVKPAYPASAPTARQITVITHYLYRQADYNPTFALPLVRKEQANYGSPEATLSARASAMTALDYDWWLSTWDGPSRALVLDRDKTQGRTPQSWLDQWKALHSVRMTLRRRIDASDHVILIYVLASADGKEVGGFEFPAVLHKLGKQWFSTQDLANNPLLTYAPWASGVDQAEETVR